MNFTLCVRRLLHRKAPHLSHQSVVGESDQVESQSHSRKRIYSCATRFKPLIRFDCPAFGFQIYLQSEFKTISNSIFVMLLISGYINTCISVTEPLVQNAQCDKSWRAIDSYRNSVAFLQNLSYSERCLESFVNILVRSNF